MNAPKIELLIFASVLLIASSVWAVRPPPLPLEEGCELWRGAVSGNDPTVQVEASLCPGEGNAVTGRLQWSSLKSGWNVRRLEGRWQSERRQKLSLRDTAIVEERPEPGWRFCRVDQYDLEVIRPNRMEGRYVSRPCDDTATIWLERQEAPSSDTSGPADTSDTVITPATPLPEMPALPAQVADDESDVRRGCLGCAVLPFTSARGFGVEGFFMFILIVGKFGLGRSPSRS